MRYPKFIARLGDSLAKLIADIKTGLRFYDKHKENKITIDHVPPKNPEYRDIWIDTSHEYIPPTQYFTVFIIQGPHQTIKISDGIGEYISEVQLEANTHITVTVVPDEGYDASKPNLTHFVLSEDTVVEALTEPTKTMIRVDIIQVPHQTITAHYNGKNYTEPFMAEYGSTITFTATADKNYYEGTLNYDRIDKLTEPVIIMNTEPPRVQSYLVRINQSDHQRISVEYAGKTYYETFAIPVNVVHDYAVYIEGEDGWEPGEIKEVKDKNKRGTTISASPASPIMMTITVEQYQNQNIWVYVTEPSGTVEVYKERFSITVPMNSYITTKVVARDENWTSGVANIQEATIRDNIIIFATEATGSDGPTIDTPPIPVPIEEYNVTLVQSPYQTIICECNGNDYTKSFKAKYSLPLILKYSNVDTEMFVPGYEIEKWDGLESNTFTNPTYNINSSNKDIKATSRPSFKWEVTGTLFENLPETMKETDRNKTNKIFSYGLVRDASRAFIDNANVKTIDCKDWIINGITTIGSMFTNCNALTNLDVSKWDTSTVTNMREMFRDCYDLKTIDVSNWNTSKVKDMYSMFRNCKSLTSIDTSKWNTSSVTDMSYMFSFTNLGTSSLESIGTTSNWNTSNVTNMASMFSYCNKLQIIDVSGWDTSKVTNINSMFVFNFKLTSLDVSKWNTSNVTNMGYIFNGCNSLTSLDVSKWNTTKVTYMRNMFYGCSSLTSLDVSNFDTSKVTDMESMFHKCSSLTSLDVSKWVTNEAANINYMFYECRSLTSIDVSRWNTSNITSMRNIFYGCRNLKSIDVSKWVTSKATNMVGMFGFCTSLTTLDVSKWNTSNVTDMNYMFNGCSSLTSLDISNWNTSKVTIMENMFCDCRALKTITGVIDMKKCTNYATMFDKCSNLTNVKIKNLPTDIDTFCNIAKIDKSKVTVVS